MVSTVLRFHKGGSAQLNAASPGVLTVLVLTVGRTKGRRQRTSASARVDTVKAGLIKTMT